MQQPQKQKGIQNQSSSIINKFDIFGVSPKLYINNETVYRTKFGSFLTLLLFGCVLVACWVYGKDIYLKENPNTTYTEEFTTHPKRFDVNPNTYSIAFVLEDPDYNLYSDPSIYTVDYTQQITTKKIENDGTISFTHESRDLQSRKCKKEDFKLSTDWFHNLSGFEHLYCFDVTDDVYIEGDFGAEVFARIDGTVNRCQNKTDSDIICKPPEVIEETLKGNYYAVFFTDKVVNPKDHKTPFTTVGRNLFGSLSTSIYKQIEYYFRNVYIQDNTGIIFDSIIEQRDLQFSEEKVFISTKEEQRNQNELLKFVLRFEKVKFSRIYRVYLNLAQVLANIGGIIKALTIMLFVLSTTLSNNYFNLNIVNQLFSFQYQDPENDKKKINKKEKEAYDNKELYFRSFWDMANINNYCKKKNTLQKREMMNFAVQKISNHLNITHILNKLMELEKLKILLLNENQLKLFEYIPKPEITQDNFEQGYYNRKSQQSINNLKQPLNLCLLQDIKSQDFIQKEAYDAYKCISKKDCLNELDKRLIAFLDGKNLQELIQRKEISITPTQGKIKRNLQNLNNKNNQYQKDYKDKSQQVKEVTLSQDLTNNMFLDLTSKNQEIQSQDLGEDKTADQQKVFISLENLPKDKTIDNNNRQSIIDDLLLSQRQLIKSSNNLLFSQQQQQSQSVLGQKTTRRSKQKNKYTPDNNSFSGQIYNENENEITVNSDIEIPNLDGETFRVKHSEKLIFDN